MPAQPPFSAIRAFESTARLKSMRKASEELHVTPSAITHRIKVLETWIGGLLFHRERRSLALSNIGESYYIAVHQALDALALANLQSKELAKKDNTIKIATMSTFAALWLVPRLTKLREITPGVNIHITTEDQTEDLLRGNIDLAIRYGNSSWDNTEAVLLYKDEVFPVCSKEYLNSLSMMADTSELKNHTLLHHEMQIDWSHWADLASHSDVDVTGTDFNSGPYFDRSHMAVESAIRGEGLTLASKPLVTNAISKGWLVRPFKFGIIPEQAYYLVCPSSKTKSPELITLIDWILAKQS